MADLNTARQAYLATQAPGTVSDDNSFVSWWLQNIGNTDPSQYPADFEYLAALADSGNQQAIQALNAGGYQNTQAPGAQVPLEQGLLDQVSGSLLSDVTADEERRKIADQLAQQALAASQAATNTLSRTQGGGFDGAAYFAANPDVAQAYERQGGKDGNGVAQTQDQFAEAHYLANGQREGRAPAYRQNAQLAQDFDNANRTTAANTAAVNTAMQSQLAALAEATAAMQANLSGNLAARAAALQQQIATLNENLTQLDATQKATLTEQIASMQASLEESIGTQRAALQQQLQTLQGAAGSQAAAQRAALTNEIQALTAAQAPMAEARKQSAQLQATAVNVGLERTKDQLTADAARSGFVGGSTVQDAALARASIDARQRAGEAVSAAELANASDTRDIATRGATGERTIAEALADAQRQISGLGATGEAALTTAGATGRQQIKDAGATGLAGIQNQTALGRASLGAQGANTTFNDQVFGADQKRALADALAQGGYGVKSAGAQAILDAERAGNAAKATYYDNDYARSLAAALAIPGIASTTASTLTGLDNYATSGLNRTQGLLNWWAAPTGAAPTPGALATNPDQSGNAWATIGSSLIGTAGNIGNANQWWRSTTPVANSPTGYTTPGGNVGVQTDWSKW